MLIWFAHVQGKHVFFKLEVNILQRFGFLLRLRHRICLEWDNSVILSKSPELVKLLLLGASAMGSIVIEV
jgi:hypothetical protein